MDKIDVQHFLNISQSKTYDVIVVGAGPAGVSAAIVASRNGAKVLLLEQEYCLGGMWTSGFVNPMFDHKNKEGLLAEIKAELEQKNLWGGFWDQSFIYEYMKVLLEEKCIEAGVEFLYDTKYIGAITDGNRVKGVYVTNIEGVIACYAKIVIDASGDGCVAADAGAEWHLGEGESHSHDTCQAMTLMFLVTGIPEKYKKGLIIYDIVESAFKKQGLGYHLNFDKPYLIPLPNCDCAVIQLTHMLGYDPLSAKARTDATVEGRKQMIRVFEALHDFDDDFKNLDLVSSAPLLGIRESRRIIGEYYLTDDDVIIADN